MHGKRVAYPHARPHLTIEHVGSRHLGNCYSSSTWRVTSLHRLSSATLLKLNGAGVLGFGQEFYVRSQADGQEAPAVVDTVEAAVFDERTDVRLDEKAVNYKGDPVPPSTYSYYVYECESRCDSGD